METSQIIMIVLMVVIVAELGFIIARLSYRPLPWPGVNEEGFLEGEPPLSGDVRTISGQLEYIGCGFRRLMQMLDRRFQKTETLH